MRARWSGTTILGAPLNYRPHNSNAYGRAYLALGLLMGSHMRPDAAEHIYRRTARWECCTATPVPTPYGAKFSPQVETGSESSTPRGAWESPMVEPGGNRTPFAHQRPGSTVPAWLSNWRLRLALSSQVTSYM